MSDFLIRFLTRDGCRLCEDARPAVMWAVGKTRATLVVVDVDTDDDLADRYGERIPVVLGWDNSVLAEGHVDRRQLKRAIRAL